MNVGFVRGRKPGSPSSLQQKSSRRQVILGCINPYEPPCKAAIVRQQLKQEEDVVLETLQETWKDKRRVLCGDQYQEERLDEIEEPVSLNRIEGVRGGDGMLTYLGRQNLGLIWDFEYLDWYGGCRGEKVLKSDELQAMADEEVADWVRKV
ncbi:hypothetical protein SADUNF_Sadunf19G0038300 [Salix dunnii]|uniref:Uncharacterized protein n=1 Tax=Salix dunnii TaxID=1413687 RepID=A0A835J185_9ROSI|nr:hypothetical protein SADUNF_Sadunf19G0038300 [Salix dunnii]